jgi:(p)ppGpp synthase/HD superfamily hydrolase
MLEKALKIATEAHKGQVDKAGKAYILHPLRVAEKLEREDEKVVALLHDVLEDTPWTLEGLREEGFKGEVLEALDLLTKRDGQEYWDYLAGVKGQELARKVKLADLADNMDLGRLREVSDKDLKRQEKYAKACEYLMS